MAKPRVIYELSIAPRPQRLLVSPRASLAHLDKLIQEAFDYPRTRWSKFSQDGREFGELFAERGEWVEPSAEFTVRYLLLKPGDRVRYECATAPTPEHEIVLVRTIEA